jgi:hypothetical protein
VELALTSGTHDYAALIEWIQAEAAYSEAVEAQMDEEMRELRRFYDLGYGD